MQTPQIPILARADLIESARNSIWRLFEAGLIDDEMATTSLLAIDLGTRRCLRRTQATHAAQPSTQTPRAA
jgi:hypothetical protein